jgi:hypothetical protein
MEPDFDAWQDPAPVPAGPTETVYPDLDFNTPYNTRTKEFYQQRDSIIETGLDNSQNTPRTRRYFEAWTDAARELQTALSAANEQRTEELEAARAELDLMKGRATTAEHRLREHATALAQGSKEFLALQTTSKEQATEIARLNDQVDRMQRTINAKDTQLMNLKYTTPPEPKGGRFSLKPKTFETFHGQKQADIVYTWIQKVERGCWLRAYETGTGDSTEMWASYVINYLRDEAAEWAALTWPNAQDGNIPWLEFKQKFLDNYIPSDAVAQLHKEFDRLCVGTSSIKEFNTRFRGLLMRVRLVSKDNGPALRPVDGKADRETMCHGRASEAPDRPPSPSGGSSKVITPWV